jgi:ATP-dependent RNA helicase DHX34
VPEILRMPLDSIVLEIKSLGLGEPRSFDFLERPSDQSIVASLEKLSNLGCIDEREEITNLGRVLSALPIDSVLGKMLVLGSISELLDPVLAIAACLSIQSPFTRASDSDSKVVSKKKELFSTHGDPFTLMNLFAKWLEIKADPKMSSRKWCKLYGVEEQRMYEIVKLKAQFEGILKGCTLSAEFETKKVELDEEGKHERRMKKRDLAKMKLKSRANTRKFLKMDDGQYANEEEEEQEFSKVEEIATVEELEFSLNNNATDLLYQTDVTSLPHRQLTIIKLIICSGLYPNIAICDESNYSRPPADQVYHTKSKRFLSMIPNSVFAFSPEVLHGEVIAKATEESLETLHDRRTQREVLSYVQLLETTKPYLMNVVRVGALPVALLFAKKVDITHDLMHLVIDEWLVISFPSSEIATEALELGNWLRCAWGVCIDRKLENFTQSASIPQETGVGTRFEEDQVDDVKTNNFRTKRKLNTLRYLPTLLHTMREDWHRFSQTGDSEEGQISDVDVMDKIVDLVDFEIDYNCQKLKMTSIMDLFGYDPYLDHIRHLCVRVTPNFNYYPSQLDQAERDFNLYQLPPVVKQELKLFQKDTVDTKTVESTAIEDNISEIQRRPYDCPICEKTMYFALAEIFKHRKSCTVDRQ